ncbi:SH3 domain-containing protein [Pedobacter sp. AW1-32]|uniref:SH3 domain-containing protein n=1 Tax=Pedobacter sp. AW1-32 TaxID=3383026 RepID=UPI003FF04DAB
MIRFLILSIALFFTAGIANAQIMYKVTADKLNVRETDKTGSKIIGFIPQGENVAVLDSTNKDFFKVKVTNGEGYVSSSFLVRVTPVAAKPAAKTVAAVEPKVMQDNSSLIFFVAIALIVGLIIFLIFKFVSSNRLLIAFCTFVVLILGYFCYITFVQKKIISGVYRGDQGAQFKSFDFKSKDSVTVTDSYTDSLFTSHYTIDGDLIKLYQEQNSILLVIRDENTLVGEGFTKGTFKK